MPLAPAEPGALPWYWAQAPLPGAQLWLQQDGALRSLDPEDEVPCGAGALAALRECPAGGGVLLRDDAGGLWRLRHRAELAGARLWQAQSAAQSRLGLFEQLRGALGGVLAGPVRHELTGPVQTLTFHFDAAGRLPAGDARFADNLKGIREHLRELHRRQVAVVTLWLGGAQEPAAPVALGEVLAESRALLQGHFGALGAPLRWSGLELLDGVLLPGPGRKLRLGWLALLLMAGSRAARRTADENRGLKIGAMRHGGLILQLEDLPEAAALGPWFATQGDAAATATAAVLLEEAGLELLPQEGRGIRLEVHALRQEACTGR